MSYLNFKAVLALPRPIKAYDSFELFGALYMYISGLVQEKQFKLGKNPVHQTGNVKLENVKSQWGQNST